MEMAEFILKIVIIATLSIGIFGLIAQSSRFMGTLDTVESIRISETLTQAVLGAKCLTEKVSGEGIVETRRGVFEVNGKERGLEYFDKSQNLKKDFCLIISDDTKWLINVIEEEEYFYCCKKDEPNSMIWTQLVDNTCPSSHPNNIDSSFCNIDISCKDKCSSYKNYDIIFGSDGGEKGYCKCILNWEFGNLDDTEGGNVGITTLPVAIKHSENEINPGKLTVYVKK